MSERPILEGRCLRLGEQRVPLLSGAAHYFRLERSSWRPALQALQELGLPMVESYVPWGVHEPEPGRLDFGEVDPRKNLDAFLRLAGELGLLVVLRPGPNINAELTYNGLPRHVVLDPENQARSPAGRAVPFVAPPRMFPVPSYASAHFRRATGAWFQKVSQVVAPHLWPEGPVVLLQIDNEAAFYFRDGPYAQDYHPDARRAYIEFLKGRHGTLAQLCQIHDQQWNCWEEVEPPARFDAQAAAGLPRALDWMRFQEHLLCDALQHMREQLRETGLGAIPMFHNLPLGDSGLPASGAQLSRAVDLVGLDYYHRRRDLKAVKERTLRLAGQSPLPYSPELGVGAPFWFAPLSASDSLQTALCALAFGLRGFNLYMAVDRDRWYGAPIDVEGKPRPSAEPLGRLIRALQQLAFHELDRKVEVAICLPREYALLTRATHTLGALSPAVLEVFGCGANDACLSDRFGFAAPIQLAWTEFVQRARRALDTAAIPYVYVDGDQDLSNLPDLKRLFAPTFEFAERSRIDRLRQFAARGGRVLFGPQVPHLDEDIRPRPLGPGEGQAPVSLDSDQEARALLESLAQELRLRRPFPAGPAPVESSVHYRGDQPQVLFLMQTEPHAVQAEVELPFPARLVDVLDGSSFEAQHILHVPLEGCSCRMLRLEPAVRRRPSARAQGRAGGSP